MFDKAFELTTKALMGEQLTDEEKSYLHVRDAKYKLVRFLYMEKTNSKDGPRVTNFHFTPGESFDDTPIIDIVNTLLYISKQLKHAVPVQFDDSNKYGNPPHTGMVKRTLGGIDDAGMDPQD
jgi:hypothetical protein